jgi:nitrogen regulatory protein PII 1
MVDTMKMIFAIVRPEKIYEVNKALSDSGYAASTKWSVAGRGKQHGIQVGDIVYDEMSKNVLMVVCDDEDKNEIIDIIIDAAQTGESGNSGDGKIFVLPVEESYTISSQSKDN